MSGQEHRILVVTSDPLTASMPGPAIRAWHMAEELSTEHVVVLATTEVAERTHPSFLVRAVDELGLRELEAWCEVLVFQGGLLHTYPFLRESSKVIVADVYDPFHLESLEQTKGEAHERRNADVTHLNAVINEQLERGDYFMCASTRQRDFWLGSLTALGRVNPATYDHDPTLASLVTVVPFGLSAESPARQQPALRGVVPGIGAEDKVILWAGGVYNWFDPLTLVRAVALLKNKIPEVRLFFLGMKHPNPNIPAMRVADELRELAAELGLVGSHVFFNEGWIDYEARSDYLLEADVGVTTHLDHMETAYSFRTRILDYIWAGLPVVATEGDSLADLIATEGLGRTVAPADVEGLRDALLEVLGDEQVGQSCRANALRVAPRLVWHEVLEPLLAFCRDPRRAPDLAGVPETGSSRAAVGERAVGGLVPHLVATHREGGPRLVFRWLTTRARRALWR